MKKQEVFIYELLSSVKLVGIHHNRTMWNFRCRQHLFLSFSMVIILWCLVYCPLILLELPNLDSVSCNPNSLSLNKSWFWFHLDFYLSRTDFLPLFFGLLCFYLPGIPICLKKVFLCQLTLWNDPFDDGEVGREAFLSDGAVSVDCQCQDASVGDDSARRVLPTVPPDVWPDWREKANR